MNDIALKTARPQPTGQPETIAAGLVGHADPRDRAARRHRCIAPPVEQPGQPVGIRHQLLQRFPLEPWHQTPDQPARTAQFDYRNQRAILIEGDEGPAEVVKLRHGALLWRGFAHPWCHSLAARPIASTGYWRAPAARPTSRAPGS